MALLKSLHKYQLELIALNSTLDPCLKDLLSYMVSTAFSSANNVNGALSNLLKSSPNSLNKMHFVTTYPAMQGLVLTDDSENVVIRDEIKIEKLDSFVIFDLILHQPNLREILEQENLVKSIEVLKNFRVLVANENSPVFWERFDTPGGIKLSFADEFQTWSNVWRENKQSVIKIIKLLRIFQFPCAA